MTQRLGLGPGPRGTELHPDLRSRAVHELDLGNRQASARLRIMPLTQHRQPAGVLVLVRDTTEIQERERQLVTKDATIREIHHRVKNNLQTVAALLRLQSRRMTTEEARSALHDAMNRVAAIAVVHEILSQAHSQAVEFDDIADRILRMVGDVAALSGRVNTKRVGTFGLVPAAAATSLSLVITELCQNAVEHGLKFTTGHVELRPVNSGQQIVVDILDDGAGLPPGFDMTATNSLGLSIVSTLVDDAGGTFTLCNRGDEPARTRRARHPGPRGDADLGRGVPRRQRAHRNLTRRVRHVATGHVGWGRDPGNHRPEGAGRRADRGQEERRRDLAWRRFSARRSSSLSPPHTPWSWPLSSAQFRHCSRTSQRRQTRLASSICKRAGPVLPMGKKSSGSSVRQAALWRQSMYRPLL